MKNNLEAKDSQLVSNANQLKMLAADGKKIPDRCGGYGEQNGLGWGRLLWALTSVKPVCGSATML